MYEGIHDRIIYNPSSTPESQLLSSSENNLVDSNEIDLELEYDTNTDIATEIFTRKDHNSILSDVEKSLDDIIRNLKRAVENGDKILTGLIKCYSKIEKTLEIFSSIV